MEKHDKIVPHLKFLKFIKSCTSRRRSPSVPSTTNRRTRRHRSRLPPRANPPRRFRSDRHRTPRQPNPKTVPHQLLRGTDGKVLNGTPLPEAAATVIHAEGVTRPPAGFMVNCTHPRFFLDAYEPDDLKAYVGIQANGSSKDVTALDGSNATETAPIDQ